MSFQRWMWPFSAVVVVLSSMLISGCRDQCDPGYPPYWYTVDAQASESAPQDGSPDYPFSSIDNALEFFSHKPVCIIPLQLKSGTYESPALLSRSIQIRGEGAENTTIRGSIYAEGIDLELEDLKLTSTQEDTLTVRLGSLTARRIWIENTGAGETLVTEDSALDLIQSTY